LNAMPSCSYVASASRTARVEIETRETMVGAS
jgi:hypothetical protein